ncbi:hypothetical protein LSTR_LSTR005709 [Laodelphax striatellus]|uniref:Uncharacterized protein n=1 Tax=Laodelphax striatellus TaxID=195883 RepID=A0A482XP93_LAOST|nr:hypothetical protein LSTR_LSTR005709 [Laodelphax striatellus]
MKLAISFFTIVCLLNCCLPFPSLDYDDSLDKIAEEIFVSAQKSGNVAGFMDRIMDNLDVFLTLFRGNSTSITSTGNPQTTGKPVTNTTFAATSSTEACINILESNEQKLVLESKPKYKYNTTEQPEEFTKEVHEPKLETTTSNPQKKYQFENNDIVKAIKTINGEVDTIPVLQSNYSVNDIIQFLFGHDSELKPFTTTEPPTTEDILARLKDRLQNKSSNLEYGERISETSSTEISADESTEKPGSFQAQILQLLESDGKKKPETPTTCYCFTLPKCVSTTITTTTTTKRTFTQSEIVTVPCIPTTCPALD